MLTHMNSHWDGVGSTTWSFIGIMPDGSLPRLKSCLTSKILSGRLSEPNIQLPAARQKNEPPCPLSTRL